MVKNTKKNTIFAKVSGRTIVVVEICVQSDCLNKASKKNKRNSYKWFNAEHFSRLISKLEDVVLARVMAPPENCKKKTGKTSHHDSSDMLPDPELLIRYQFVKRRKYRQTVLIRSKKEIHGKHEGKNNKESEYSGGGYQSLDFFPEKLKVTVSQISLDSLLMSSELGLFVTPCQDKEKEKPLTSTISKYFSKDGGDVTQSTQKKRAALKNMNKKNDPQSEIDSLICATSTSSAEFSLKQKDEKTSGSSEVNGESKQGHKQIYWMEKFGDVQEMSPHQEGLSSKEGKENEECSAKEEDEKDGGFEELVDKNSQVGDKLNAQDSSVFQECEMNTLPVHADDSESVAFSSADACNIESCASPKRERLPVNSTSDREEATSKRADSHETVKLIVDEHSNSKSSGTTFKRPRSNSESDSWDSDSLPSLRSRIAKKTALKKHKGVSVTEVREARKESDSDRVNMGDDNDFETPKGRRNVEKRKASDVIDDQDTGFSKVKQSSEVEEGLGSKKRKTSKATVTGESSDRKATGKPTKRKINKRPLKTTSKIACDILEDLDEEPGSSPLEPITIEDKPPVVIDASTIEDLTLDQTEQLVWELASELREIFEGKKYCRRHEDYKRGGRMKGDLAFQVQFGQFTEEQRDTIMGVLTAMFCYKHSKYFDYVSKVLLPETLVMLYMKVVGRTRDEAELSLLERTK